MEQQISATTTGTQLIETATRLAQLGQTKDAQETFTLAIHSGDLTPEQELAAASFIFYSQGEYQIAYTSFVKLYNLGHFQGELMNLMSQAFYFPNVKDQKRRYQQNCEALSKYPYLFQKNFLPFEELPILFFPYNDNGYLPFYQEKNFFGEYINFSNPVIDRYFFRDLEKPVLAHDVYSQYQLEYLNDTVRKSEWVGRENHIYLHYSDWATFCAYLQCLDIKDLLYDRKFVFLIGEEIAQYPIDFKERFHIDYTKYPLKPIHIREIHRLIWHTQLAAHNGGDFFNEIFYEHPNLLVLESFMFDKFGEIMDEFRKTVADHQRQKKPLPLEIAGIKHYTDKEALIGTMLKSEICSRGLDKTSRIAPAVFIQPHFKNMIYHIKKDENTNACIITSKEYDEIKNATFLNDFKYIKTFTPIRRPTTSYAATVRFMFRHDVFSEGEDGELKIALGGDVIEQRLANRSYMIDWQDRLFADSILVRFEDGKLNPKATFTALAEFLDLPYTQTMTYCSGRNGINPVSMEGNVVGFDATTVYRTYDEYANDSERAFLEYFLRDVYEYCGYDFQYYKGEAVDEDWIQQKIEEFTTINGLIRNSRKEFFEKMKHAQTGDPMSEYEIETRIKNIIHDMECNRLSLASYLYKGLRFVNQNAQPLRFMKKLQLDPELLEQPLYH